MIESLDLGSKGNKNHPLMEIIGLIAAIFLVAIFSVLSLLHVYWAVRSEGAPEISVPYANGKPVLSPGKVSTLIVALLLAFASVVCLWRIGILSWSPGWIPEIGNWAISIVFFLRAVGDFRYVGFFKRITDSKFAYYDTRFYSPLCLAIALAATVLGAFASLTDNTPAELF